jgi:hypothetical protein
LVRIDGGTDAYLDAAVVQSGAIEVIRFSPPREQIQIALQASKPWRAIFKSADSIQWSIHNVAQWVLLRKIVILDAAMSAIV